MKKNTKASFIVSLICAILMLTLMIPTGAINALADNNFANNNNSTDTNGTNGAVVYEYEDSEAVIDEDVNQAGMPSLDQQLETGYTFNGQKLDENLVVNDENVSDSNTTYYNVNLSIDPEKSCYLNDGQQSYYGGTFQLDANYNNWTAISVSESEYRFSSGGGRNPRIYSIKPINENYEIKSVKIDSNKPVEINASYSLSDNSTITIEAQQKAASNYQFKINFGELDQGSTFDKPDGWKLVSATTPHIQCYKEFAKDKSYSEILSEWKNDEHNYFKGLTNNGKLIDETYPLGESFNPESKLQDDVVFEANWKDAITVTANLDGGSCSNAPSDWTVNTDGTYCKKFLKGTIDTSAASDWANSDIQPPDAGTKFDGFNTTGKAMDSDTELKANYRDIANYDVTFTMGDDYKYLDMAVDGKVTEKSAILSVAEDTAWNMVYSDQKDKCTISLGYAGNADSHSIELTVKGDYKNVLYPKISLDGSEATEGNITENSTFIGEPTWYESTKLYFDFASGSENKGFIYDDYTKVYNETSFIYDLPKGIDLSYCARSEGCVKIDFGEPFDDEESLSFLLKPKEDTGVNMGYFSLNGTPLTTGSRGDIHDGDKFYANFYQGASIQGQVTESGSGKAVESANVKLIDSQGNTINNTSVVSGNYSITAPVGQGYKLVCEYSNDDVSYYNYVSEAFDLDTSGKTLDIELNRVSFEDTVKICGQVLTYENCKSVPVENAVFIFSCLNNNFISYGYTDSLGVFYSFIPKDQPGIYTVATQNRMGTFAKTLDAKSSNYIFDDPIYVYQIDQSVSATLCVNPDDIKSGLIERDYGTQTQSTTFTDEFDVAKIGDGQYKYPTCYVDDNGVVTITSIYDQQYKYTPLRYGGYFFESWTDLPDGDIEQSFTAIAKFSDTGDYSLSFDSSEDNFDNYFINYKNSDGKDEQDTITTPSYTSPLKLYEDTILIRDDNNKIILSYLDEGEIEGGTYSETMEITINSKNGYIVDTISVDGVPFDVSDRVTIQKDTNVAVTFTEGSIVEGIVSDSNSDDTISDAEINMIDSLGNTVGSAYSGDDGQYSIQIPSTKLKVGDTFVITCKDFFGSYFDYTEESKLESSSQSINIAMEYANPNETVLFEGIVVAPVEEQSNAVSNARVSFSCLDSNFITTTYTDSKGIFSARIPKDKSGMYSVSTQNRFTSHLFAYDATTQSPSGIVIPVYKEDSTKLNVTFEVNDPSAELGLIEKEIGGVREMADSFTESLAKSVNGAYPTYTVNDDDSITVTTIYFEKYTFSPKRYGGCSFVSWDKELPASGNITQDFTMSAIFSGNADFAFTLNCSGNGFESYDWNYEENDGYKEDYTIYENPLSFSEYLYNGTQIIRNEDNTLSLLYSDDGEIEGGEYSEQLIVGLDMAEGYDLDSISINGETIDKNEYCYIDSDTNIDFTLKSIDNPTPIPSSNSVASPSASGTSNSASTSDYMIYAIIALFILAAGSASGLYVRNRKNQ